MEVTSVANTAKAADMAAAKTDVRSTADLKKGVLADLRLVMMRGEEEDTALPADTVVVVNAEKSTEGLRKGASADRHSVTTKGEEEAATAAVNVGKSTANDDTRAEAGAMEAMIGVRSPKDTVTVLAEVILEATTTAHQEATVAARVATVEVPVTTKASNPLARPMAAVVVTAELQTTSQAQPNTPHLNLVHLATPTCSEVSLACWLARRTNSRTRMWTKMMLSASTRSSMAVVAMTATLAPTTSVLLPLCKQ
jgi:hypothetical protein